jgi:bifunctional DNA primase/polymerase-like protein
VSENAQHAHAYASLGFRVFPLVPRTKRPLTSHGLADATADPEQITRWWWCHASAGVAIRTGAASRIIVLDVDPRAGGDESFAELEHRFGKLPSTPIVHTGGGGAHYYFANPGAMLTAGAVPCRVGLGGWPGIDLKADGGYVVAPPSIHPNGERYVWDLVFDLETTFLADTPAWILELAAQGRDVERVPYQRAPLSEESEIRIANAIGLYENTYLRFHERSRAWLRGSAAGITESEVDYGLACSLAIAGLTGSEIEWALRESRQRANLPTKRQSYYQSTIGKALGFAAGRIAA